MLLMRPGAGGGPLCKPSVGCDAQVLCAAPPARVLDVPPPEDARACKKHHLLHWKTWEANPLVPAPSL